MTGPVAGAAPQGRLEGKVAVITGGGSGIGLATARRFVAEGARVLIADLDAERLQAAAGELGDRVATQVCDVRLEDDVAAVAEAAVQRFGAVDVVFANAGIGSLAPIVDAEVGEWMRVIEVNLLGPVLTIKHAAPRMRPGGSVILTASLNAVQAARGMSAYCCSKAALAMLAQVAAMELGPGGIRVNAIGPGLVKTNLTDAMWLMPSIVEEFVDNAPLGTHPTVDDVANLVLFLASDESSSISGVLHLIDGAAHTRRYPDIIGQVERASQG